MHQYFLPCLAILWLSACTDPASSQEANKAASTMSAQSNVSIQTAKGMVTLPKEPSNIAVFDWAALDTLTQLGVPVMASTDKVMVDYLAPVFSKSQVVGTLFEPNYEALSNLKPDLIITGGPGAVAYDELKNIAPTIDMTIDNEQIRQSAKERIQAFSVLFNQEAKGKQLIHEIDQSFDQTRILAKGIGNGMVLSITGQKISAFGPQSRLGSWIHLDLGIPAADNQLKNSAHGQLVSFEYIKEHNPDWIFVLDRTSSLGEKGDDALTVLDNPLTRQTTAWQKGHVIVMHNANYIVAGGAYQLKQASQQLATAFTHAKKSTH